MTNLHTPVGDVLFSVIPSHDLSIFFLGGAWVMLFAIVWYAVYKNPQKIPFFFIAYATFFCVRGICISLTHIGIPPDHITPSFGSVEIIQFFRNDLFFSGHTGVPFLAALLSWENKKWRYFFLITSFIMVYTVISMRLHYTIDIIGAYFITYGVFHIATAIKANLEKLLSMKR